MWNCKSDFNEGITYEIMMIYTVFFILHLKTEFESRNNLQYYQHPITNFDSIDISMHELVFSLMLFRNIYDWMWHQ